MTLIRTAPAITSFRRVGSATGRRWRVDPATAIGVAVFVIVLIADVLLIAGAAPSIADLDLLYVSSI
jgi:hypothetical protein